MSENDIKYLPYETAARIVGAVQEEEHIQEQDRRIFTVYDRANHEICWFDAEDTINIVAPGETDPKKEKIRAKVQEYILHHIPEWTLDNS